MLGTWAEEFTHDRAHPRTAGYLANELLIIRRDRPGVAPYWVLPGGHLEPEDPDLESGLHREIYEELGGKAEIISLVAILDGRDDRQYIYLARIESWSEHDRTGPEFAEPARGTYTLSRIPLAADAWADIDLKPEAVSNLIQESFDRDGGLFALPDLGSNMDSEDLHTIAYKAALAGPKAIRANCGRRLCRTTEKRRLG